MIHVSVDKAAGQKPEDAVEAISERIRSNELSAARQERERRNLNVQGKRVEIRQEVTKKEREEKT